MGPTSFSLVALLLSSAAPSLCFPSWAAQEVLKSEFSKHHNDLYVPNPAHPVPGKVPYIPDEKEHWFDKQVNGSGNGYYRRSSCPAVNMMANRGYINRSGRDISYEEIAAASRELYNFGDDNIIIVLGPSFAAHPGLDRIDLDMLADDAVQYVTNCPAAPTRNDRVLGDNVNLNHTLLQSMLSFSKDGVTLTLEDMAEHHHLRHNDSLARNPAFRFSNSGAICSLAQYANLFGILGRQGKHGLNTLYVDDVREFFVNEDLPAAYARRELPYFSTEANNYIDRMTHHIGFEVVRPYPENDGEIKDVEPVVAKFDKEGC